MTSERVCLLLRICVSSAINIPWEEFMLKDWIIQAP